MFTNCTGQNQRQRFRRCWCCRITTWPRSRFTPPMIDYPEMTAMPSSAKVRYSLSDRGALKITSCLFLPFNRLPGCIWNLDICIIQSNLYIFHYCAGEWLAWSIDMRENEMRFSCSGFSRLILHVAELRLNVQCWSNSFSLTEPRLPIISRVMISHVNRFKNAYDFLKGDVSHIFFCMEERQNPGDFLNQYIYKCDMTVWRTVS